VISSPSAGNAQSPAAQTPPQQDDGAPGA
jgi:hypothetical protein